MELPQVRIQFGKGSSTFKSDETIEGKCYIESTNKDSTEGIEIILVGEANVGWTDSAFVYITGDKVIPNTMFTSSEKYFEHIIYNSDGKFILQKGSNEFPFKYDLPCGIPNSFYGSYGEVVYVVRTVIHRISEDLDQVFDNELFVESPLPLSSIPKAMNPVSGGSNDKSCLCCWCNSVSCTLTINHLAYAAGDPIIFECEIRNKSKNDTRSCEFSLNQVATYFAEGMSAKAHAKLASLNKTGTVLPRSSDYWKGQNLEIPVTTPPTNLGGFGFCDIIKVEYFVELDIKMQGNSVGTDVRIPVIISSPRPPPTAVIGNGNKLPIIKVH